MNKICVFVVVFSLSLVLSAAEDMQMLSASDPVYDAAVGISVAVSGDTMVAGAQGAYYGENNVKSGAVYVFNRNSDGVWKEGQKIGPVFTYEGDWFGSAAAISGDYIIAGAYRHGKDTGGGNYMSKAGAAYIFKKGSDGKWTLLKKLVAPDRAENDFFGITVSVHGDYAAVGASGHAYDTAGENQETTAGAVYIFGRNKGGDDNWGLVQKVVASDRKSEDRFGTSVYIFRNFLIAGAPTDDIASTPDSGSAYILRKAEDSEEWKEVKKLRASDRTEDSLFGISVAISEDYAVIGSQTHDLENAVGAGSAYIFKRNHGGEDNWGEVKMLAASDASVDDSFGISVALAGNTAVVGSYRSDYKISAAAGVMNAGAAYVYRMDRGGSDNWGETRKITPSDAASNDVFGISVAAAEGYIVFGASGKNSENGYPAEDDAGAVYILKDEGMGTVPEADEEMTDEETYPDSDMETGEVSVQDEENKSTGSSGCSTVTLL